MSKLMNLPNETEIIGLAVDYDVLDIYRYDDKESTTNNSSASLIHDDKSKDNFIH